MIRTQMSLTETFRLDGSNYTTKHLNVGMHAYALLRAGAELIVGARSLKEELSYS